MTLFAHGARRPKSPWRSVLMPFQPMLVSWSGRGDGGTLTGAEIGGAVAAMPPAQLLSAFYLNELLLRLLPKEDRHERLYDAYGEALADLRARPGPRARCASSNACCWMSSATASISPAMPAAARRSSRIGTIISSPVAACSRCARAGRRDAFSGHDVIAVARGEFAGAGPQTAARRIFGAAIAHCLEGRSLASREVMMALRRQEQDG